MKDLLEGRTPGEKKRVYTLIDLARAEFGSTSEVDERVLAAAALGEIADFSDLDLDYSRKLREAILAETEAMSEGRELPDRPTPPAEISADLLVWLLTNKSAELLIHSQGVRLVGVLIEDDFEIINSKLNYPLWLNHSIVKKSINFTGSTCRTVLLNGTRIGEDPLVSGKDECLLLGSSHINGNVFLRDGFLATGGVRLSYTAIDGQLSCVGGRFWAPGGVALHADGVRVNSGVFLSDGFLSSGEVRFIWAEIKGQINCNSGVFRNSQADALILDGVRVAGNVFLGDSFVSFGTVRLIGATIAGQLGCAGGRFFNSVGYALYADRICVTGDVFIDNAFESMGVVSFGGAQIGGDVACSGSLQLNANRVALTLEAASIGGALHFHNLSGFIGTLVLSRSRIGCLFDGPVAAGEEWPASLVLTDSRYDSISVHSPMDTTSRLRWLNLHDSTIIAEMPDPQPYRWLAEVMKKQGHEDEARTVLRVCAERRMSGLAERARRDIESNPTTYCGLLAIAWFFAGGCAWLSGLVGTLGTWAASFLILLPALVALLLLPKRPKIAGRIEWLRVSFTQRLYKYAVGHGYARWRAIGWMAAFILLGFVMFSESSHPPVDGRMQPVQALALKEWSGGQASTLVDSLPKYNALIYSADTLIPLVSFHQQDHWMPSGNGRWGWFIKNMYLPFHITMGWVIATLFVASFTRLMRQEG